MDFLDQYPEEQINAIYKKSLAFFATQDNVLGLESFYKLIYSVEMPEHVKFWCREYYRAREDGKGLSLQAFRGSTKTTFVQCVMCHQIGLNPTGASMVIQVSDDKADKFTKNVASIIEFNTGWKEAFPHVVPDKQRGWSSTGYEVMDDSMPYDKWRDLNAKRTTPSLIGCGWSSGMIVGFHPTLLLVLDDILDRNNTDSQKSMEAVRETIKASINPAAEQSCFRVLAFTPWKEDDPVIEQSNSGNYISVITPIYVEDEESELEWNGIKYRPTWPVKGTPEHLQFLMNESDKIEFARMYLLDLKAAQNKVLKYHSFPYENIKANWPMGGGVDYASARTNLLQKTDNDYFAMAYAAKIPGGGVVIYDGVLERGTQATAEAHLNKAQDMFPNWITSCVESNGKGEDFIQVAMRNPNLRIMPKNAGRLDKKNRILKELGPWLESGQVRISTAESPFLIELRRELNEFPDCKHDDALDAVYYSLFTVSDALKPVNVQELEVQKVIKKNPYSAFRRN